MGIDGVYIQAPLWLLSCNVVIVSRGYSHIICIGRAVSQLSLSTREVVFASITTICTSPYFKLYFPLMNAKYNYNSVEIYIISKRKQPI